MKLWAITLFGLLVLSASLTWGQSAALHFPEKVEAGTAFSVPTTGSGSSTLYIVGPGDAVRRQIQLGESVAFGPEDLHNAGHYIAFLTAGSSTESAQFDVLPAAQPASLSFLARPSRLSVNLPNGLSGVAYVFDAFRNLVLGEQRVSF